MNYFAHGVRFLDRPYFLAGTALPDWLSVVDRRSRLRARNVLAFAEGTGTPASELAAGVLQHLEDDAWFHRTAAFVVASAEITVLLRAALPADDGHRPAFLGHILTEILLDAVLIARHPALLTAYYQALAAVDAVLVEESANRMLRHTTDRLQLMIPLFISERFLADYLDGNRLLSRLNQVLRRVKLNPLPADVTGALEEARQIVERRAPDLLPNFAIIAPPLPFRTTS